MACKRDKTIGNTLTCTKIKIHEIANELDSDIVNVSQELELENEETIDNSSNKVT